MTTLYELADEVQYLLGDLFVVEVIEGGVSIHPSGDVTINPLLPASPAPRVKICYANKVLALAVRRGGLSVAASVFTRDAAKRLQTEGVPYDTSVRDIWADHSR